MPEDHQAADPAQAFEDLRAEVSVLRKAIEALPDALDRNRAPDYSADFGVIGQGMDAIGVSLENLQKHPALKMTAEQHGAAIANAGSGLIREAAETLRHAAQGMGQERYDLSALIGTIRAKSDQRFIVIMAAVFSLIVGLGIFMPLACIMPFGLNNMIAARIVGGKKWDAGIAFLNDADPNRWAQIVADTNLVDANRDKITDCQKDAAKAKKDERCSITVKAPSP